MPIPGFEPLQRDSGHHFGAFPGEFPAPGVVPGSARGFQPVQGPVPGPGRALQPGVAPGVGFGRLAPVRPVAHECSWMGAMTCDHSSAEACKPDRYSDDFHYFEPEFQPGQHVGPKS